MRFYETGINLWIEMNGWMTRWMDGWIGCFDGSLWEDGDNLNCIYYFDTKCLCLKTIVVQLGLGYREL